MFNQIIGAFKINRQIFPPNKPTSLHRLARVKAAFYRLPQTGQFVESCGR